MERSCTVLPVIAYQFTLRGLRRSLQRTRPVTPADLRARRLERESTVLVAGWPQNHQRVRTRTPTSTRRFACFLAVVGTTREHERVKIHTTARVIPGGPFRTAAPEEHRPRGRSSVRGPEPYRDRRLPRRLLALAGERTRRWSRWAARPGNDADVQRPLPQRRADLSRCR